MERPDHNHRTDTAERGLACQPLPERTERALMSLLEILGREKRALVQGRLADLEACLAEKKAILEELSVCAGPTRKSDESVSPKKDIFAPQDEGRIKGLPERMRLAELKKKVIIANERNRLLLEDCSRITARLYGLLVTALTSGTVYAPDGKVELSPPTGRLLSRQF